MVLALLATGVGAGAAGEVADFRIASVEVGEDRTATPLPGPGRRGTQRSGIKEEAAGRGTAAAQSAPSP